MISLLRAIVFGTAGGAFCYAIGVPAPWLAGSLMATIIAIYANQKLDLPDSLRTLTFILLGVQTGTTVNADTLERVARWPLSIFFFGTTVVLIVWGSTSYYVRFRNWDKPTALFASLPGALSLVILLAGSTGADMRRVTVAQSVRVFFLIAALPVVIEYISPVSTVAISTATITDFYELLLLVAASAAAGLLFARLKIPAGLLLGAALASAALGLGGIVHGAAPNSILIPANIILGVMIGLRFTGISLSELRAAFSDGFAGFIIAMVIAMAGAVVTSAVADLPLALTLLAFSPGGLEAMTIMAFALNLDPAYVAAHQIARYIGLVLFVPAVTGFVLHRSVALNEDVDVEKD